MAKSRKKKSVIAELLAACRTPCERQSLLETIRDLEEAGEDVEKIATEEPVEFSIPGLR